MPTASTLRHEIESALAARIPSALTPQPRTIRPVWPTGIAAVDELLRGGLPVGAITEIAGPQCSGRTSLALSFVAASTQANRVCAWVDVSDALSPEAAAAAGVQLDRLLWIRCGVERGTEPEPLRSVPPPTHLFSPPAPIRGLHGGGCGAHPRTEMKALAPAVAELLQPTNFTPRCAEPLPRAKPECKEIPTVTMAQAPSQKSRPSPHKPWPRIEQALRATDLLLQTGGFSVIVLDLGSVAPEAALRIPLATWFRFRAGADRTQASVLLLTQTACAKSSAGLVLKIKAATAIPGEPTVFRGLTCRLEVVRERHPTTSNVVALRKPPARENTASWQARSAWTGLR